VCGGTKLALLMARMQKIEEEAIVSFKGMSPMI
jgi:hypothetical protein